MRQPWSGKARAERGDARPRARAGRQRDPQRVAAPSSRARSGRSTAARRRRSARAGRGSSGPATRSGSAIRAPRRREAGVAEADGVAGIQAPSRSSDHRVGERCAAQSAALPGLHRATRRGRASAAPDQRPGRSTAFSSTSCRSPDGRDQHRAHLHHVRQRAPRARAASRAALSGKGCEPLSTSRSPPRMRAAVVRQSAIDRRAQRADRGDDGDAQRQAQQHDPQAAHAAAQLPPGQAKASIRATGSACTGDRSISATRPSAEWIRRAQRAGQRRVVGDQHQRGAGLGRAGGTAGPSPPRRSPGPGCRSARRPAAAAAAARRRGPAPRAAARRRKAGRADGSADAPARPHPAPPRARPRHRARPASSSGTATFSSAVMVGIRWNAWNTMPIVVAPQPGQRVLVHAATSSCPASATLPAGRRAPARPAPSAGWSCRSRTGRRCPPPRPPPTSRSMPRRMLTGPAAEGTVRRRSRTCTRAEPVRTGGVRWHPWRHHMALRGRWRKAMLALAPDSAAAAHGRADPAAGARRLALRRLRPAARARGSRRSLQAALRAHGHDVTIVDGAVSGDTTAGGRARLDWALGDGADAAIVELGANDGLRGARSRGDGDEPDRDPRHARAPAHPGAAEPACTRRPISARDYDRAFRAVFDRLGQRPGHAVRSVLPRGRGARCRR